MKVTAVIMAGGKGERFWPKSRQSMPKQFLSLTDDQKTMIQHTVERLSELVKHEDIYIVTNSSYKELVCSQLSEIPEENILIEPVAKNTAPCIGLAATHIIKKYGDAIMVVLPSDHLIKYNEIFMDTLRQAVTVAVEDHNLVTIGITPSYPETGYGYINFGKEETDVKCPGVYKVKRFVEKPNLETAKEYLASGKYLWNSGMFVWKATSIMKNFKDLLPDMYEGLMRIESAIGTEQEGQILQECFAEFDSESIDYGIMERATHIYTIPGSFGWDDVGSWNSLERVKRSNDKGNIVSGNVITIDTKDSIIQASGKLVATVGLKDVIIVDTEDALLICSKDASQDIKKVLENLKICNRNEYL